MQRIQAEHNIGEMDIIMLYIFMREREIWNALLL